MKHYTTIFFCLVLSAVLIFVPSGKAASISATWTSGYNANAARAILINQYTVDYEFNESQTANDIYPFGNTNIYVYEITIEVKVAFNTVDGYVNGYTTGQISYSASTPTGYSLYAIDTAYTPFNSQGLYSVDVGTHTAVGNSTTIRAFANNFWAQYNGATEIGNLRVRFLLTKTATPTNIPDPPEYITISVGASQVNSVLNSSVNPEDQGYCDVIKTAIINAINDSSVPFEDILTVLESIRTQDQTNYTTIVQYLADNDTFNSTLYQWLQNVLESDFSALLDDTTFISTYLYSVNNILTAMNGRDAQYYPLFDSMLATIATRLQTLIDLQNAAGTQANNVESAADNLENQINQANNYQAPDVNFMLTQADQIMVNGQSGMNLIATIINEPWIVQILLVVVSLAFVGYLLYGKGV